MALTKTPIELSSTPGIVDNSNATAITIDASENVGIGTSSPRSILDLDGGSETQLRLQTNNTGSASSDGLLISLDSSANADAYLWNYENAAMIFGTNAIERMRIDASGHLMVGTTDTAPGAGDTNAGVSIRGGSDNRSFFSVNGDYPMHLNRNTNDGEILWFAKNGGAVGSAGTTTSAGGTRFAIGAVGDPGIIFAGTGVFPATQITASDNSADLGSGTYRWKDIYLSGGAFLGGTGAGNKLTDYEEGTFTPHLSFGGVSAGVSWNVQAGKYTKIGNLVTVGVYLYESTGRGSQTGNATVNLPFSLSSSTPDTWLPISNRGGVAAGSNKTLTLYGNAGSASFRFYSGDNSGGGNTVLTHTAFSASGSFEVSFTVTYRTDA
jgi:hypothetical protein